MSLAIKYEREEDARMRLRHTVVLYKGEPVYVLEVKQGESKDDIIRVLFKELPFSGIGDEGAFGGRNRGRIVIPADPDEERKIEKDDLQRKYISSKHFDIAPFRMGYVNSPTLGAFYSMRMPNRVQKQGLCGENFRGVTNQGKVVSFASFLACKETRDMVAGKYPSFEDAWRCLDKVSSVAFSRDFCLVKDEIIPELIYLYYKGEKVGLAGKTCVNLGGKFNCLKESLEEMKLTVGGF